MKSRLLFPTLVLLLPSVLCAQVATIVASDTDIQISNPRSAVIHRHLVVRVNSEHGVTAGLFMCPCNDEVSLSKFSGNVIDAQGRELLRIKKSDLLRSEYAQELRTDSYHYFFGYEAHNYPYTVTYDWEQRYDGGIPYLPAFVPQSQYDVDVLSASYSITSPSSYSYQCHAEGFTPQMHHEDLTNGMHRMRLNLTDLPVVTRYEYGSPLEQQVPQLYVTPDMFYMKGTRCDLSSWQQFGYWVYQLMEGRDKIPASLSNRLQALTDTCTTLRSKVEAVRQMMGQTTRYVGIQEGLSGYQCMSVDEVFRYGLGDCKALSNYLCSMLHHLGIPADYALISTSDSRLREHPSLQQLDHVIARVPLPDDTLWIECTNPNYPYYHLPADLCDHEVIIITPQGGQLARTPALTDDQHCSHTQWQVSLNEQGLAEIHYEQLSSGWPFDQRLALMTMNPTDQRKAMVEELHLPKSSISQLTIQHKQEQICLSFDMQSQGYAKRTGNRLFVPLCPNAFSGLRNPNQPPHDIYLKRSGYVQEDTITIHLPEGYAIELLPEPQSIETPFGSLTVTPTPLDESTVQVSLSFTLHSNVYPASLYDDWLAFRKGLTSMTGIRMIIARKPTQPAA